MKLEEFMKTYEAGLGGNTFTSNARKSIQELYQSLKKRGIVRELTEDLAASYFEAITIGIQLEIKESQAYEKVQRLRTMDLMVRSSRFGGRVVRMN